MKNKWVKKTGLALLVVMLSSVAAHAQTAPQSAGTDLLQKYAQAAANWSSVGFGYAKTLFGILAAIEFAWLGAMLAIEGHELQAWLAQILKKMMTVMFFYALLINYKVWVPAIISSFQTVGQQASGISQNLSPSDILYTGLQISGNMLAAAMPSTSTGVATAAAALIPGLGAALTVGSFIPALIVLVGALAVFAAYLVIMIAFIMATIESYICLGAGVIFLGFGASRWTVPYVERYLSLAVSTGVRLMVMYMIIGLGQQLGAQWISDAQNLTLSAAGCESILGIVAGAVTFMAVAWSVPKMVSGILSGSVSLGSSDLIGPATAAAVGAATAAAAVATGGAALAGTGAAATAAGGGGALATGAGGVFSSGAGMAGSQAFSTAGMATEAAAPLAVDPIAGGMSSVDANGSTVAGPESLYGSSAGSQTEGARSNASVPSGGADDTQSSGAPAPPPPLPGGNSSGFGLLNGGRSVGASSPSASTGPSTGSLYGNDKSAAAMFSGVDEVLSANGIDPSNPSGDGSSWISGRSGSDGGSIAEGNKGLGDGSIAELQSGGGVGAGSPTSVPDLISGAVAGGSPQQGGTGAGSEPSEPRPASISGAGAAESSGVGTEGTSPASTDSDSAREAGSGPSEPRPASIGGAGSVESSGGAANSASSSGPAGTIESSSDAQSSAGSGATSSSGGVRSEDVAAEDVRSEDARTEDTPTEGLSSASFSQSGSTGAPPPPFASQAVGGDASSASVQQALMPSGVPETPKGRGAGHVIADHINTVGATVEKLASHAPQDSHAASAPSINLNHGE